MNAQITQPANPAPVRALAIPPEPPERLSTEERTRLQKLERMMDLGMERFLTVGEALLEIRESKLYREKFPTFCAYCEQRWNMSARRGYQLIQAVEIRDEIASVKPVSRDLTRINISDPAPLSAKALCALAPVEPGARAQIVDAVRSANNGAAPVREINKEIARHTHRKQPAKPKPRETFKLESERQTPVSAVENPAGAPKGAVGGLGSAPASSHGRTKTNGKPKRPPAKGQTKKREVPLTATLGEYDDWQDKSAARWQRDFGARAWRAYNAQVFGILREVREWWARKLEGGAEKPRHENQ